MQKKILFLTNHFVTLFSFRKELIEQLTEEGYDVYISMPENEQNVFFENMGCKIIHTDIERRGTNPVKDINLFIQYKKIMKKIKPDIIFSYTIKPNIYGSMASNLLGYKQVCNITGTGATFLKETIISKIARAFYRISIKRAYKVFFQNNGDRDYFINKGMINDNYEMLPGSGVNLEKHTLMDMPEDSIVNFIFIGRVMGIKGIDQYLECAKEIKNRYPNTHFYIAGWNEEEKYKQLVEEYSKAGWVEYIGYQKDIDIWISRCHCTILPSLGGEGIPNVLLESAAVGRVCIASDINGSKDVVEDGVTGFLFQKGNGQSLIDSVEKFLRLNYDQKKAMGIAGHDKISKEYNRQIVIQKYIEEVEKA